MEKMVGFIGGGNMGSAMMSGIIHAGLYDADHVIASCKTAGSVERLHSQLGIYATTDNCEIASRADILFLAVKPNLFATVIPQIRSCCKEGQIVVSIAAGQTIQGITDAFQRPVKLVRGMPNTPALVGQAMSALTPNEHVREEELAEVLAIFESFGEAEVVPEHLMDAVVGVSGSSPAYIYMMIEAMADAAVADGMPRAQAYKFAAQSVKGAAQMVLQTGTHPGSLKDAVCSPSGTTIAAVAKLEENGFRSAVIDAQRACVQKSRDMSRS